MRFNFAQFIHELYVVNTDVAGPKIVKGQLISEWLFHLNQKTNENNSVFLPYLSKIRQIKKRMQIIILE